MFGIKKIVAKIKKWWQGQPLEKKQKKLRIGGGLISLSLILWRSGPVALIRDFQSLVQTRFNFFAVSLGIGGVLANTPLDSVIHRYWCDHFKGNRWLDGFFAQAKKLGEHAEIYVHALAGIFLISKMLEQPSSTPNSEPDNEWLSNWAKEVTWHFIEGTIIQGVGAAVLGSTRPEGGLRPETGDTNTSHWRPFRSRYGVSGHALHGAFPWLVAAETTPLRVAKPVLYAFAALPGLSRLHTSSHYPSQIFLGWSFAYATASHVTPQNTVNTLVPRLKP